MGHRSANDLSRLSERDDSADYIYQHPHVASKFAGLSTHCSNGSSLGKRGGRNVVTWNDILGQDFSLSPKASNSYTDHMAQVAQVVPMMAQVAPMPTGTVKMASPQTAPNVWMESCEAGDRTAWHTPLVTPWNPPYWESNVKAYGDMADQCLPVNQPEPKLYNNESMTCWLQSNGMTACNNDLAEQLRAAA